MCLQNLIDTIIVLKPIHIFNIETVIENFNNPVNPLPVRDYSSIKASLSDFL